MNVRISRTISKSERPSCSELVIVHTHSHTLTRTYRIRIHAHAVADVRIGDRLVCSIHIRDRLRPNHSDALTHGHAHALMGGEDCQRFGRSGHSTFSHRADRINRSINLCNT